jgi:hypothetical protein
MTSKLKIEQSIGDINLKFYYFLKFLMKAKLTNNQIFRFLECIQLNKGTEFDAKLEMLFSFVEENIDSISKSSKMQDILNEVNDESDILLLQFSIKLYSVKDLLLQEAKTTDILDITKLENLHPLSLTYDKITTFSPYSTRVSGALLTLLFFRKLESGDLNFLTSASEKFMRDLIEEAIHLRSLGVEPNQIFMLMFTESMNQSITSDSGSNYEDRIKSVLLNIGIPLNSLKKTHDKNDTSTEFDFFFEISGRTYGIGAKRTLRERYKQFIKTAQMSKLDVMIEITLGTDIRPNIAQSIVDHKVILFVADEVYLSKKYLQKIDGVFPASQFTLDTLESL